MSRHRTLGVIPARGGSKGIPRKNIKLIAGRPLIAWTIEAALMTISLDRVIVSTEDEEIAAVARLYGADVPFTRPAELAQDTSPGIDPVLHALDELSGFDAVVVLQPTSPLRSSEDIAGCIARAGQYGASSAVSVTEQHNHPFWMYSMGHAGTLEPVMERPAVLRRQDLPRVYSLNGAVYYAKTEWLRRERALVGAATVGYVMPPERSVDLDTPMEWELADLLLRNRK